MRVTESILRKNSRERANKKTPETELDHLEMSITRETKKGSYFNSPTPIQQSEMEKGLNAQESLFDNQATFRLSNRR